MLAKAGEQRKHLNANCPRSLAVMLVVLLLSRVGIKDKAGESWVVHPRLSTFVDAAEVFVDLIVISGTYPWRNEGTHEGVEVRTRVKIDLIQQPIQGRRFRFTQGLLTNIGGIPGRDDPAPGSGSLRAPTGSGKLRFKSTPRALVRNSCSLPSPSLRHVFA